MDFVAIDFETANQQRDSACAVGITQVRNGIAGDPIFHLIRPLAHHEFSPRNIGIHGITAVDVADAPTFGELWPEILPLLENQLIVAHNASFDMSVLRHSFFTSEISAPQLSYLCTLNIARRVWPALPRHKLNFLAKRFNLQLDHHHAGSDSLAAAELLLLAAKETNNECPFKLAKSVNVSVGKIYSGSSWEPSSAPNLNKKDQIFEVVIPDGYDITKHPFHNKTILFTGQLDSFTRANAGQIVEKLGGKPKIKGKMSKNVHYLVTGEQDLSKLWGKTESSKLRKARELREQGIDVQIISGEEFEELVCSPSDITEEGESNAS